VDGGYRVDWYDEKVEKWVNDIKEGGWRRAIYRLLTEVLPREDLWRYRRDRPKQIKHLGGALWEIKVARYRLLFCVDDEARRIAVVYGYVKKGRRLPVDVMQTARKRCERWVRRS